MSFIWNYAVSVSVSPKNVYKRADLKSHIKIVILPVLSSPVQFPSALLFRFKFFLIRKLKFRNFEKSQIKYPQKNIFKMRFFVSISNLISNLKLNQNSI